MTSSTRFSTVINSFGDIELKTKNFMATSPYLEDIPFPVNSDPIFTLPTLHDHSEGGFHAGIDPVDVEIMVEEKIEPLSMQHTKVLRSSIKRDSSTSHLGSGMELDGSLHSSNVQDSKGTTKPKTRSQSVIRNLKPEELPNLPPHALHLLRKAWEARLGPIDTDEIRFYATVAKVQPSDVNLFWRAMTKRMERYEKELEQGLRKPLKKGVNTVRVLKNDKANKLKKIGGQKRRQSLTLIVPKRFVDGDILQEKRCSHPDYAGFEKCRACRCKQSGDTCRFVRFRAFSNNGFGEIDKSKAPSFFDDQSCKSSFLIPPFTESNVQNEIFILRSISNVLYDMLIPEHEHVLQNNCYRHFPLTEVERTRHFCDSCLISIFNSCWTCCVCGANYCLECYIHGDFNTIECTPYHHHTKKQLIPMTKFSKGELQKIIESVRTQIASIPLELQQEENQVEMKDITKEKELCTVPLLMEDIEMVSLERFQDHWRKGEVVVIRNVLKPLAFKWDLNDFILQCRNTAVKVIDCATQIQLDTTAQQFFDGFSYQSRRPQKENGQPLALKLEVRLSNTDLKQGFHKLYESFRAALPFPKYTDGHGSLNLAARLPACFTSPILNPKIYVAYGSDDDPGCSGTINLHCDPFDIINIMLFSDQIDQTTETKRNGTAIWHIFHADHLPELRDFLTKVATEQHIKFMNPILEASIFLDPPLLQRLELEKGIKPYVVYQNVGDTVFIPAGCPYQVFNYISALNCSVGFVSPENVAKYLQWTSEFRKAARGWRKREDKLQLHNIIYAAFVSAEEIFLKNKVDCNE